MSHVNHLLEEFSEQNLLLQVLLGVLSETERVERLLPRPAAASSAPRVAAPTIDPFVAALLGVVSLRQQLRGAVTEEAARRPTRDRDRGRRDVASPSSPGRRRPPTIRELMR